MKRPAGKGGWLGKAGARVARRGYLKKQYKAERGREWVRSARRGRTMPQNEHIELFQKRYGKRLDHEERTRKKEARAVHTKAKYAQKVRASFT